jgi:hypothetical protein
MMLNREDPEFMKLGFQYYVAARSAAMAHLVPVCGNLYHHSLEMFLKAGLSRQISLADLANPTKFGHKLLKLWPAFKSQFDTAGELDEFDVIVTKLEKFEDIRYPEKILELGAQMLVEWGTPSVVNLADSSMPLYHLRVNELDRLIAKLFVVSSRNPLFFMARSLSSPHAWEIIRHNNPVADQLLSPQTY